MGTWRYCSDRPHPLTLRVVNVENGLLGYVRVNVDGAGNVEKEREVTEGYIDDEGREQRIIVDENPVILPYDEEKTREAQAKWSLCRPDGTPIRLDDDGIQF